MNNKERSYLNGLLQEFDIETRISQLEELESRVSDLESSDQEKVENMPDSIRESDAGQAREQVLEQLSTLRGAIETAKDSLQEALDALEEINNL